MVRISKRKLNEDVLIKIYQLFFEVMARSVKKERFFMIIDDIFSPAEKIMIAKRLAIIYLLIKNIDQRNIAHSLKVSTGTVSKFSLIVNDRKKKINEIFDDMIIKEKALGFLEDVFNSLFIQPGIKKGHWKYYWDYKKKQNREKEMGI